MKKCTSCGSAMMDNHIYCGFCGAQLGGDERTVDRDNVHISDWISFLNTIILYNSQRLSDDRATIMGAYTLAIISLATFVGSIPFDTTIKAALGVASVLGTLIGFGFVRFLGNAKWEKRIQIGETMETLNGIMFGHLTDNTSIRKSVAAQKVRRKHSMEITKMIDGETYRRMRSG